MVALKPTFSFFTGSGNLGQIYQEQQQINIKVQQSSVALTTTAGNVAVNFGGKTRILVVQGAHDGTGFTGANQNLQILAFVNFMELWVNASVSAAVTFTDSFGRQYNVIPTDFSWIRSNKDSNRIIYTIVMVETVIAS